MVFHNNWNYNVIPLSFLWIQLLLKYIYIFYLIHFHVKTVWYIQQLFPLWTWYTENRSSTSFPPVFGLLWINVMKLILGWRQFCSRPFGKQQLGCETAAEFKNMPDMIFNSHPPIWPLIKCHSCPSVIFSPSCHGPFCQQTAKTLTHLLHRPK